MSMPLLLYIIYIVCNYEVINRPNACDLITWITWVRMGWARQEFAGPRWVLPSFDEPPDAPIRFQ